MTGIQYLPLFRYEVMLAVARQHALALKGRVEPEDLQEEVLIIYPVEHDRLDVFTQFLSPPTSALARSAMPR